MRRCAKRVLFLFYLSKSCHWWRWRAALKLQRRGLGRGTQQRKFHKCSHDTATTCCLGEITHGSVSWWLWNAPSLSLPRRSTKKRVRGALESVLFNMACAPSRRRVWHERQSFFSKLVACVDQASSSSSQTHQTQLWTQIHSSLLVLLKSTNTHTHVYSEGLTQNEEIDVYIAYRTSLFHDQQILQWPTVCWKESFMFAADGWAGGQRLWEPIRSHLKMINQQLCTTETYRHLEPRSLDYGHSSFFLRRLRFVFAVWTIARTLTHVQQQHL